MCTILPRTTEVVVVNVIQVTHVIALLLAHGHVHVPRHTVRLLDPVQHYGESEVGREEVEVGE